MVLLALKAMKPNVNRQNVANDFVDDGEEEESVADNDNHLY